MHSIKMAKLGEVNGYSISSNSIDGKNPDQNWIDGDDET